MRTEVRTITSKHKEISMKKLMALMLGLSLVLGTSVAFAGDDAKDTTKKQSKKKKKSKKTTEEKKG